MGFSKNIAQKKVDSNASLPKEKRETSNKQPNFIPKASGKKQNKTKEEFQVYQKERNHKNQSRINEKEMKETKAKINITKS